MAWAKNYLFKRKPIKKSAPPAAGSPNQKRIRPRAGWLPIGRGRKAWRASPDSL